MEICCNCGQVVVKEAAVKRLPSQQYLVIIEEVAARHNVPAVEILSGSRKRNITIARQEVYYLMYKTGLSSAQIGRLMRRDHTSILHGIKQHQYKVERSMRLALNNRPTSGGEYASGPMAASK